jgi:hypothetical protein
MLSVERLMETIHESQLLRLALTSFPIRESALASIKSLVVQHLLSQKASKVLYLFCRIQDCRQWSPFCDTGNQVLFQHA